MDRHRQRQETLDLAGLRTFSRRKKTTNLRMECSHECARKACVRVPHAQDLTYEALNDWRRS